MATLSPTPIPSAPPEPPSPITTQMIGVGSRDISNMFCGDHLGLAALLGADARIGAGRVDEADDRQAVLGGQLHLGQRLAIALGMGTAEIAGDCAPWCVLPF